MVVEHREKKTDLQRPSQENAVKILGVDRNDVIIAFKEEPRGNWYASGVTL